uniref:Uncharacterized protein n=1 Tax=Megaselia scalaris TaxID=36166 RepID=T1GD29_MEGSC
MGMDFVGELTLSWEMSDEEWNMVFAFEFSIYLAFSLAKSNQPALYRMLDYNFLKHIIAHAVLADA